tara:strand:- start:124 stop:1032 length:909 start_codon:yes stop_codon:yes gene_type:complete
MYLSTIARASSDLKVFVTIKPYHSLVSGVMEGVGKPVLIIDGNNSPHSYTLLPSIAKRLQEANIIFWGGQILEGFLSKSIKSLAKSAKLISLVEINDLTQHNFRSSKLLKKNNFLDDNDYNDINKKNKKTEIDPHIWLNPINAKKIINKIVQILINEDPLNEEIYIRNGKNYKLRLDDLDKFLGEKLKEVINKPFFVFHDAYQYLEKRYNLKIIGSFILNSSYGMSVRRLQMIKEIIKNEKIICVFSEPKISQKLLITVVKGTSTKIGILDPIGIDLDNGSDMYFKLMDNLIISLRKCILNE